MNQDEKESLFQELNIKEKLSKTDILKLLCLKAKEFDLLLVPGSGFGAPGHFRLAYCVQTDMIHRALPRFKALAKAYGLG